MGVMVYKPTYIWGAPSCRLLNRVIFLLCGDHHHWIEDATVPRQDKHSGLSQAARAAKMWFPYFSWNTCKTKQSECFPQLLAQNSSIGMCVCVSVSNCFTNQFVAGNSRIALSMGRLHLEKKQISQRGDIKAANLETQRLNAIETWSRLSFQIAGSLLMTHHTSSAPTASKSIHNLGPNVQKANSTTLFL